MNKRETDYHGFLWLKMRDVLTRIPDGGSVKSDSSVGDVQGQVNWKKEAFDPNHECCKLRNSEPAPKMVVRGEFTRAGSSEAERYGFFMKQYFMYIYPFGTPQSEPGFWDGPRSDKHQPPKADRFYPATHLRGKLVFTLYVDEKTCQTRTLNIK